MISTCEHRTKKGNNARSVEVVGRVELGHERAVDGAADSTYGQFTDPADRRREQSYI